MINGDDKPDSILLLLTLIRNKRFWKIYSCITEYLPMSWTGTSYSSFSVKHSAVSACVVAAMCTWIAAAASCAEQGSNRPRDAGSTSLCHEPELCTSGCCAETGECLVGTEDNACGTHGNECRNCTLEGFHCVEHVCVELPPCEPGDTEPCGNCGIRACGQNNEWGECTDQGECKPEDVVACGNCGTRTCSEDCTWSNCSNEGVCEIGTTQDCGNCGVQTCGLDCNWETCTNEGLCQPGSNRVCGNCGTQTCENDCTWGDCKDEGCFIDGQILAIEQADSWPEPRDCPAGFFRVGVFTQRHWNNFRKYSVCIHGADNGTVTTCTGDIGTCTPPPCPTGMIGVSSPLTFYDRTNQQTNTQQLLCVSPGITGQVHSCSGELGENPCTPAQCPSGFLDVGMVVDHEETGPTSYKYRLCVR